MFVCIVESGSLLDLNGLAEAICPLQDRRLYIEVFQCEAVCGGHGHEEAYGCFVGRVCGFLFLAVIDVCNHVVSAQCTSSFSLQYEPCWRTFVFIRQNGGELVACALGVFA